MNALETMGNIIESDVLIIGGGISGLWAAISAAKKVKNVVVVEKGPEIGYAGQAYFAAGSFQAVPPGDNFEEYAQEMIYLGDGLYEQDLLLKVFEQSWDRMEDLLEWGLEFARKQDGEIQVIKNSRGLKPNAMFRTKSGRHVMGILAREAERLGVKYIKRTSITALLKDDNAVSGAVGFNVRTGDYCIFKSRAVVIATGSCCMKGHYENIQFSNGEGIELALNAGAELKNLEFASLWILPRYFHWEGVTALLPLNAQLVNERNEPFINKYSPVMKSNIDYNYLARFMAMEHRKGEGPFYLDCSGISAPDLEMTHERFKDHWLNLQIQKLNSDGIRPYEEKQEWMPGVHFFAGGVHSDLDMSTAVPGLFVAGKTRAFDPGTYIGGQSFTTTSAFGKWAGESAGEYAREHNESKVDPAEVKQHKSLLYRPFQNGNISADNVLKEVQETVFPYEVLILKSKTKLQNAIERIENIKHELLPKMGANSVRELGKLQEVQSLTVFSELFLKASIMREESRASHYREDFSTYNDANWLKWIMVQKQGDKLNFDFKPVPVDKYKFKITRHYADNFVNA